MADFLIQHLNKKAKEHSALAMLVNQWGFDEKLIPKALQTVGNLFPHYSRHDESHSKQILINIERLLGKKNIAKLTATDTWLLLEAAYWHDIGMVVPQKDIAKAFSDNNFLQYIEQIRNAPNHELYRFCLSFNSSDISQCFAGADTPLDAVDKFRQLMAEWFRRQHASRANTTIQAPWESAGISSPRTELIPARLFKLLGRVCYMHGSPFKDLLAPNGLPYREAGLAQEDCHPRFVACLLRMGDLLDLDDNRFCPVMKHIAGDNRPSLSKAHEDKHAGIYHLRVDRKRIEITSECKTVDGYLEAYKWFDWLKQEMQDQMSHWQDIVPSREFGLLPTLGDIEVRLSGKQQLLNEGQRPQFSLDAQQATRLLSESLYSSKYSCIRELLQNAVDATLLKLWLVNEKAPADTWKSPTTAKAILQTGEVAVCLEEIEPDTDTPLNKSRWKLTITDQGTGISRDDLTYMLRIGGSQANVSRQQKIRQMPEWMKPSGAFGIGFQSVFLMCDEVRLTTKSIFTNETLKIEMFSPLSNKEGLVELEPSENDISCPYGTTLEITFLLEKITTRYSTSSNDIDSITSQFLDSFDPILNETLPIEAARIAERIQEFTAHAPLPIHGHLSTVENSSFPLGTSADDLQNWHFMEVDGHQLEMLYQPVLWTRNTNKTLYRGQLFKQQRLYLPNVYIEINLLSGKAGHWLAADRDKLLNRAEEEFKKLVLAALEKIVSDDLKKSNECKFLKKDLKPIYSFFLENMALQYGIESNWFKFAEQLSGAWLDLKTEDGTQTFRKFFKRKQWIFAEQSRNAIAVTGYDLLITDDYKYNHNLSYIIFNEWKKEPNNTIQVMESESYDTGDCSFRYQLKKGLQPSYSQKALASSLVSVWERNGHKRFILDFQDNRWEVLYLKDDIKIKASYLFSISKPNPNPKFVLLPFLFHTWRFGNQPKKVTVPELDTLCKWVQLRLEIPASLADIKQKYEELIHHIDYEVMQPSPHWEVWKKARSNN